MSDPARLRLALAAVHVQCSARRALAPYPVPDSQTACWSHTLPRTSPPPSLTASYGVLVLFGIVPVAMAWSERYGGSTLARFELVPGGRPALVAVGCAAGAVILRELLQVL